MDSIELVGTLADESFSVIVDSPNVIEVLRTFKSLPDGMIAVMESGAHTLAAGRLGLDLDTVRREFAALISDDGPLSLLLSMKLNDFDRLVRDMRSLDPATALGQAVVELKRLLVDVLGEIAASKARAAEREVGTAKGRDFQALVAEDVAGIAACWGDVSQLLADTTGILRGAKAGAKRGDITVCLADADASFVIEVKNAGKLSAASLDLEIGEAMQNRGALAGIVVVSSTDHPFMSGQSFIPLRPNVWVVYFAQDGSVPEPLQVAYRLARAAVLTAIAEKPMIDIESLRALANEFNDKLMPLVQLRTRLKNIATERDAAEAILAPFERELRSLVLRMIDVLGGGSRSDAAA